MDMRTLDLFKLKRCAHCGGAAKLAPSYSNGRELYTAYCTASSFCPAVVRESPQLAAASWNRRAHVPGLLYRAWDLLRRWWNEAADKLAAAGSRRWE